MLVVIFLSLQKLIYKHDEIITKGKKFSNRTAVHNSSQNIENLAYFENVLKTLLDDNFIFFQEILKKKEHGPDLF